jgi:plasmid maintenance system antidote protein VapI
MSSNTFTPRWASPPGDTLKDLMNESALSPDQVASMTGIPRPDVTQILEGESAITIAQARAIGRELGGSVEFWLARDAQYWDDRRRHDEDRWAQEVPLVQLAQLGLVRHPQHWTEQIEEGLRFFGVDSVTEWYERYRPLTATAGFRLHQQDMGLPMIATWLRMVEIEVANQTVSAPFSPTSLRESVQDLRPVSRLASPSRFLPEVTEILNGAGVRVAVVRPPRGCAVSGVAFQSGRGPTIGLSARFLTDDHLWFTLFHEIAHLLLHDLSTPFVDDLDPTADQEADAREIEANAFASSELVPGGAITALLAEHRLTARKIVSMAREVDVAPGIVVGQLQHARKVGYGSSLNKLKRRYRWSGISLERA